MAKRKSRGRHFIAGVVGGGDGHVRITKSESFLVGGGTQDHHDQAVEFVTHVDREFKKDPPQTPGEARMIVRDAAKKVGLTPTKSKPRPSQPE